MIDLRGWSNVGPDYLKVPSELSPALWKCSSTIWRSQADKAVRTALHSLSHSSLLEEDEHHSVWQRPAFCSSKVQPPIFILRYACTTADSHALPCRSSALHPELVPPGSSKHKRTALWALMHNLCVDGCKVPNDPPPIDVQNVERHAVRHTPRSASFPRSDKPILAYVLTT
jgi:hypothetical protein